MDVTHGKNGFLGNLPKIGGASILTVGDSINGGEGGNLEDKDPVTACNSAG